MERASSRRTSDGRQGEKEEQSAKDGTWREEWQLHLGDVAAMNVLSESRGAISVCRGGNSHSDVGMFRIAISSRRHGPTRSSAGQ